MRCLTLLAALMFVQVSAAQDFAKLSEDLRSGDRDTRREAALELRDLGDKALPALPALIEALRDEDEQVAGCTLVAIANIGPGATGAIPALIDTMNPTRRRYDEQVIFRAAHALGKIGEPAVEPLRKALQSSSKEQRFASRRPIDGLVWRNGSRTNLEGISDGALGIGSNGAACPRWRTTDRSWYHSGGPEERRWQREQYPPRASFQSVDGSINGGSQPYGKASRRRCGGRARCVSHVVRTIGWREGPRVSGR